MDLIDPNAQVGTRNRIGHGVRIGPDVQIGDDNQIEDYVSISNASIGNGNLIRMACVLGGVSNHVVRRPNIGHKTDQVQRINIGHENFLGEFVTVHAPVASSTVIGDCVSIGPRTHIAHDAIIENRVIIGPHCCFGGYVRILEGANIGIAVNVHPRIIVGQYAMIGLGTVVIRHILPAATVAGNPQRYIKPNTTGMNRNGLSSNCTEELSRYLTGERINLRSISNETRQILVHFYDIIKNGDHVREVACVPNITHDAHDYDPIQLSLD